MNVLLHPQPTSILFWDMIVLSGYLLINIITGWMILSCNRREVPPPGWIKPLIYLSIPWAISIHTVTAFIYAGLPGRSFWLTAIMAPRFLASAFASGPALLILFCLILKRYGRFDAGDRAIQALSKIVDWNDRATAVLFGDAGGAAVVGRVREGFGFRSFVREPMRHGTPAASIRHIRTQSVFQRGAVTSSGSASSHV